jgi:uncharacterized BrkB/YihY/UPF0761 family membrane protein
MRYGVLGFLPFLVALVLLALAVYCTVDVVRQPALSTSQATLWVIGLLAGLALFGIVSFVLAVCYLVLERPKLRRRAIAATVNGSGGTIDV